MSFTPSGNSVNPMRIKLARESRGLSQGDLARQMEGFSQSYLSKVESHTVDASSKFVEALSKQLDYPSEFFYRHSDIYPLRFFYRRALKASVRVLRKREAMVNVISDNVSNLLNALEIEVDLPYVSLNKMSLTPSDLAARARVFFGVPRGPLKDIVSLMESRGIIIHYINIIADTSFSALTTISAEGVPIVFVNENMAPSRKVFTLAHELGHILMHFNAVISGDDKLIEKEANEFASHFLMPDEDIESYLSRLNISKLISLKEYWGVSIAALLYKARSLGLSEVQYKRWMAQISGKGWRYEEPAEFTLNEPRLLTKMLKTHLDELEYSENELLKLLALNKEDFMRYYYSSELSPYVKPERNPGFRIV